MKKGNILILEDMRLTAEDIAACLEVAGYGVTDIVKSGTEAIASVQKNPPDLAILDIKVQGDLSGIEIAERICAIKSIPIVYLTAFSDLTTLERAKQTNPASFLTKPFRERELQIAVELALHNFSDSSDEIIIKENHQAIKLNLKEVKWVEADGSYVDIHTRQRKMRVAMNMLRFSELAEGSSLLRVHRSFMVNIAFVSDYDADHLWIDGKKLPVSKSKSKTFLAKMDWLGREKQ